MAKNLKRRVFVFIFCTAFFLPVVLSSPADCHSDGWVKLLGTASSDYGNGVTADTSGNIYVTGVAGGDLGGETNAGGYDIFLAKYQFFPWEIFYSASETKIPTVDPNEKACANAGVSSWNVRP